MRRSFKGKRGVVGRMARVGALLAAAFLMMVGSAYAESVSFIKGGCEVFKVPSGVSSVTISATGAAGSPAETAITGPGGKGDGYSALLSGLSPGEDLYVCVDQGPGAGGNGFFAGFYGGPGGGASGVSRGSTFESPVLVAGGGGGAGAFSSSGTGNGGNAGEAGQNGGISGSGGGAGTLSEGGAGGNPAGEKGSKFTSEGPGRGGAGAPGTDPKGTVASGGGGGGGYYGGGGGGGTIPGGGGGGGSDFCGSGATSCERHAQAGTKHEAGAAEGDAKVTLTYTVMKSTTLTTSLSGGGQSGEKITVKEGTPVTDQATLGGENASKASGFVVYATYSDSACTKVTQEGSIVEVKAGVVPPSEPETLKAGTYYWKASYSGDENNAASESKCGDEVETVISNTATCGKTTIGKVSDALLSNQKRVNRCVLPVNASVSKLTVYLAPTSTKGQQLIKGIIYADSKGKPGSRLGVSEQLTFKSTNAPGWYDLVFRSRVKVEAGSYWIGIITGATSKVAGERYDSVAKAEDYNSNSYTSGASNPFGSFKTTNEEMSLYATYKAEEVACSPVRGSVC